MAEAWDGAKSYKAYLCRAIFEGNPAMITPMSEHKNVSKTRLAQYSKYLLEQKYGPSSRIVAVITSDTTEHISELPFRSKKGFNAWINKTAYGVEGDAYIRAKDFIILRKEQLR